MSTSAWSSDFTVKICGNEIHTAVRFKKVYDNIWGGGGGVKKTSNLKSIADYFTVCTRLSNYLKLHMFATKQTHTQRINNSDECICTLS